MSGESFGGTVQSIAFAIADRENLPGGRLLANINPSYTWVKLAQRVPVRIRSMTITPVKTYCAPEPRLQ